MNTLTRRAFVSTAATAVGGCLLAPEGLAETAATAGPKRSSMKPGDLPKGNAPAPVPCPHFPTACHAVVWRNWELVPVEQIARAVGAPTKDVVRIGRAMGLKGPPQISKDQIRRSAITVIRRNWHLLPYDQLLTLLQWTPDELAFSLREDDFLYIKLGSHKPECPPVRLLAPDAATRTREQEIAKVVAETVPVLNTGVEPLFGFVRQLSSMPTAGVAPTTAPRSRASSKLSPRFCYSYFALYGDPLLELETDPYPDGYLARLSQSGVDGVWMQAVLYKLAKYPWDAGLSEHSEERLANLAKLVRRARRHGIGIWLYLNEPRSMPLEFFKTHPGVQGVKEGDSATMCTSTPEVRRWVKDAVGTISRAVPDLAGFFTISGSENLTHCWSHNGGNGCTRCKERGPEKVVADLHTAIQEGIDGAMNDPRTQAPAGGGPKLIAWDWGWSDAWIPGIASQLPQKVALMSVSEWSLPLKRGGIDTAVGEYSISAIGPGPRARRTWELARQRGMKAIAKVQVGNTWELSAVPHIPAVANVAKHAANLREAKVNGLMLGWTLGGCPSPNLEVVAEICGDEHVTVEEALRRVAERRFGAEAAPAAVRAWEESSRAFSEFPYHPGTLYNAPMQYGPSNLLWAKRTGYGATMVGFPYDDLNGWRQVYPPEIFAAQFEIVADGFDKALAGLTRETQALRSRMTIGQKSALDSESRIIEAAAIHLRSTACQTRFVMARNVLETPGASKADTHSALEILNRILETEIALARRLHELQQRDSRIGFEASNQYYYVGADLTEKVVNARHLLETWIRPLLSGQRQA